MMIASLNDDFVDSLGVIWDSSMIIMMEFFISPTSSFDVLDEE